MKQLSITEFVEFGYLQEVNRAFFHPRGLALAVTADTDEHGAVIPGNHRLTGVLDGREHPEGFTFADLSDADSLTKAARIHQDMEARKPVRETLLGYWQQPLGEVRDS